MFIFKPCTSACIEGSIHLTGDDCVTGDDVLERSALHVPKSNGRSAFIADIFEITEPVGFEIDFMFRITGFVAAAEEGVYSHR
jgi:hypothetical protein